MKRLASFIASTLLAVIAATSAAQANELVINGGFETGDLTGWTVGSPGQPFNWDVTNISDAGIYAGSYIAENGCFQTHCALSQTLAITPGRIYELSFAFNPGLFANETTDGVGGDTQVFWNGNLVIDILGGDPVWTLYTFSVIASTTSTELRFSSEQDQHFNGLDAVSVTSPVPLPMALPLFASGLAGLGWLCRCRKRKGGRPEQTGVRHA
jgi:hypothetical protein